MTIAKPPRARSAGTTAEEAFVASAPDAIKPARWQRGRKTQVTVSISPELLNEVDAAAEREHLSRSGLLTVWINNRLKAAP